VAGVVVAVELVRLAVLGEDLVELVDLLGARMESSLPNSPSSGQRRFGSWSTRFVTFSGKPSGGVPVTNAP
jgi:hypothetical protein